MFKINENTFIKKVELCEETMERKNVKTVSFDIFDTLLIRPAIKPEAIIRLACGVIEKKISRDVTIYRLEAEKELKKYCIRYDEIWAYVAGKCGLTTENEEICKQTEFEIEKKLLTRRESGYRLYRKACELKKRIIVISDMYYSKEELKELLIINGYTDINEIYVSSEIGARKDDGSIYNYVRTKEKISGFNECLHIGDNKKSDYKRALINGIQAFWLPSNACLLDNILRLKKTMKDIVNDSYSLDIILGFSANAYEKHVLNRESEEELELYTIIMLFPMLMCNVIYIINNSYIQKNYDKIFFVSRDGYLPLMAYNIMRQGSNSKTLEGAYLYGSRTAYREWISPECSSNEYTRLLTKKYYHTVINSDKAREIVFDCGYSGSVSRAIGKMFEKKKIDKIYMWETEENRQNDLLDGTKTFVTVGGLKSSWLDILIETSFSPICGTCVGFAEEGDAIVPLFGGYECAKSTCEKINMMHAVCLEHTKELRDLLSGYLSELNIQSGEAISNIVCGFIDKRFRRNESIFDDLVFDDTFKGKDAQSLGLIITKIKRHAVISKIRKAIKR